MKKDSFAIEKETDLEPPRTVYRRETEKELEENDRGGNL